MERIIILIATSLLILFSCISEAPPPPLEECSTATIDVFGDAREFVTENRFLAIIRCQ